MMNYFVELTPTCVHGGLVTLSGKPADPSTLRAFCSQCGVEAQINIAQSTGADSDADMLTADFSSLSYYFVTVTETQATMELRFRREILINFGLQCKQCTKGLNIDAELPATISKEHKGHELVMVPLTEVPLAPKLRSLAKGALEKFLGTTIEVQDLQELQQPITDFYKGLAQKVISRFDDIARQEAKQSESKQELNNAAHSYWKLLCRSLTIARDKFNTEIGREMVTIPQAQTSLDADFGVLLNIVLTITPKQRHSITLEFKSQSNTILWRSRDATLRSLTITGETASLSEEQLDPSSLTKKVFADLVG